MSTVIDGSASVTINSGAILGITSGTTVATTSGTSIDFTSIPSWVKRVTVMVRGVSTSGTSLPQLQIGAGSVDTSGYAGANGFFSNGTATVASALGAGILLFNTGWSGTLLLSGNVVLTSMGSNIWTFSGVLGLNSNANVSVVGGDKSLTGSLDRIRLTTVNGTDTFDAGSINILYE